MQLHCSSHRFVPVNLLASCGKLTLNFSQEAFTYASMRRVAE